MRAVEELLHEMTLEEKISLLSGKGLWNTKSIERLGIPSLMITDGPIGIRKQTDGQDNVGLQKSVNSTCFPAGTTVACSWDAELMTEMGKALGDEAQAQDVGVLLGPAMNIKRTPLCGRNFEYLSEDPYLTGVLAAAYVKGVQSSGVASSLKHFAANNQEYRRRSMNAVIDERTLREIYLTAFEMAVKDAEPATVMSSYNRVNGVYASENNHLLNEILRGEWGFKGLVVSDWDATNDHALGLKSGLDLRMPCLSGKDGRDMMEAYKAGKISMEEIDTAVCRNLELIKTAVEQHKETPLESEAHHALVRKIAGESMVLLKNKDGILPLSKTAKIAIIGDMAVNLRYQGGGSSHVEPFKCDDLLEEMKKLAPAAGFTYAKGYDLESDEKEESLFAEALGQAKAADVVIVFAGLPEHYESEGYDREHIDIPPVQNMLISEVAKVNTNTVVVLANGAAVAMPWVDEVSGILESYLGGEAAGGAIADILFGKINPSGKLAETFPVNLRQTPAYLNYPGYQDDCYYREGVFVGYRYYTTKDIKPLFPFGYGLSYTTFEYSDIYIDKTVIREDETVTVSITLKNTGDMAGKEIVQLYVHDNISEIPRPEIELRHFSKISLQPGEAKRVSFTLGFRDFAYFDVDLNRFAVESGVFTVFIGGSSESLPVQTEIEVCSLREKKKFYTQYSTFGDVMADDKAWPKMLELAMRDPFYKMVFSGEFQNTDPEKVLGYNLLKELGDTDTIGEAALQQLLDTINKEGGHDTMKTLGLNPYLPFWETVPDGEPHVFDGRLYIFGSHDRRGGDQFCMEDYVGWSAPVEDPGNWQYEGVIYRKEQDPLNGAPYDKELPKMDMPIGTPENLHYLYAPDVAKGPDGRYYLYYSLDFSNVVSVAVCDTPAGQYEFLDFVRTEDGRIPDVGRWFDPAILSEESGNYLYYGFAPEDKYPGMEGIIFPGSQMVKLADDMHTIISEPVCVANGIDTAKGTCYEEHPFFEASSIRKIGDWYYFVYSSLQKNELCYGMAETPEGPFEYKGVIISNGDLGLNGNTLAVNYMGNNHGGLVEVKDKVYIFAHRHTHGTWFSRQGTAEEVQILEDGTIPQVEVTSCGLNGGPLPAKGVYQSYIACHITEKNREKVGDAVLGGPGEALPELPEEMPYVTEEADESGEKGLKPYIANLRTGAVAGFKYFAFDGTENSIEIELRGKGAIEVMVDAPDGDIKAVVSVESGEWMKVSGDLNGVEGTHALYFKVKDGTIDFAGFEIR